LTKSERESPFRLKVFAVSIQSSKEEKPSLLFYFNLHDTFFDPAEQVGRILLQSELAISASAAVEATCLPHQFNLRNTLRKMLAVSVARRTYGIG
jgi:hypothetical protein